MGMKLARAAAQRARDAAVADAQPRLATDPPATIPEGQDPGEAFDSLARSVLQLITLEAQIAGGFFNRVPASAVRPAPRPLPKRTAKPGR